MLDCVGGFIMTVFALVIIFFALGLGVFDALPLIGVMGLLLVIGIYLIVRGGRQLVKDYKSKNFGDEVYGMVAQICPSGTKINDRPVLNAEVVIVETSGVIGKYVETIGTDCYKYRKGDFLLVSHYEDDINIISKVDGDIVPENIKNKIMSSGYVFNYIEDIPPMYGAGFNQGYGGVYQNYNQGYNQGYQNYNQGNYNQPNGQNESVYIDGVEYVNDENLY